MCTSGIAATWPTGKGDSLVTRSDVERSEDESWQNRVKNVTQLGGFQVTAKLMSCSKA